MNPGEGRSLVGRCRTRIGIWCACTRTLQSSGGTQRRQIHIAKHEGVVADFEVVLGRKEQGVGAVPGLERDLFAVMNVDCVRFVADVAEYHVQKLWRQTSHHALAV